MEKSTNSGIPRHQFARRAVLPALMLSLLSFGLGVAQAGTITVANTADSGVGSLRQAIADASPNDTIDLAGVNGTITLTSGQLAIGKSLTVKGPGAAALTISGNNAGRIFFVTGSAVNISGLTLTNGKLSNQYDERLDSGGAIFNSGKLTVSECAIDGNTDFRGGGGIYNTGDLTVNNSIVSNNSSGGLDTALRQDGTGSSLTVNNCTITKNGPRGIYNYRSTTTVKNCTIVGQEDGIDNSGKVFYGNTLFADNFRGGLTQRLYQYDATFTSLGHNLFTTTSPSYFPVLPSDQTRVGDPKLGPLAKNGGGTQTLALMPGSPAMDNGDDALLDGDLNSATDQRGSGYFRKAGQHVDIGAYEDQDPTLLVKDYTFTTAANAAITGTFASRGGNISVPTFSVVTAPQNGTATVNADGSFDYIANNGYAGSDSFTYKASDGQKDSNIGTVNITVTEASSLVVTTTSDDSTDTDNLTSLREAINYANSGQAGAEPVITFAPNVAGTIILTQGPLGISNDMTISGSAVGKIAVSGNDSSGVFSVSTGNISISGLTITHSLGSAIVNNGTLTVTQSSISHNSTQDGGVILNYGTLTVTNSTLSDNTADAAGGGIVNGYANGWVFLNLDITATLNNCTISGNTQGIVNAGTVIVSNTILNNSVNFVTPNTIDWANWDFVSEPPMVPLDGAVVQSQGYNLSSDAGGSFLTATGDKTNVTNMGLDPVGLQNNGGPTQTIALMPGSPAINAGDPLFDGSGQTDQRGTGFDRVKSGRLDIGAFESDLMVAPANTAPVANAGEDQEVTVPHDGTPSTYTVVVKLDGSGSSDRDGDALTYKWSNDKGETLGTEKTLGVDLGTGEYTFTLMVDDGKGLSNSDTVKVKVSPEPNQTPVANAGVDQTVECTGSTTSVSLDGSASSDADGDALSYTWSENKTALSNTAKLNVALPLGTHILALKVTDAYGATNQDEVKVVVQDTTAPVISGLTADKTLLWPANHQWVDVMVNYNVKDATATTSVLSVSSNEPTNGLGDGDTGPDDWQVIDNHHLKLRAERSGKGTGRTYTITVTSTDSSGNSSTKTTIVFVPKSNSGGKS